MRRAGWLRSRRGALETEELMLVTRRLPPQLCFACSLQGVSRPGCCDKASSDRKGGGQPGWVREGVPVQGARQPAEALLDELYLPFTHDLRKTKCPATWGVESGHQEGRQPLPQALRLQPLQGDGGEGMEGSLASSLPGTKEKGCTIHIFLKNPFRRG